MTMFGASWGLGLEGITPTAKLVAIRLGDGCDVEGKGRIEMARLAEFCCCGPEDVREALILLSDVADVFWGSVGNNINYELPPSARPQIRRGSKAEGKLTLYVMTGTAGVKVGITSQLGKRVAGLRVALLDDNITCVWSVDGAESVIRKAERTAHESLSAKLYRNEWFTCTEQEAIDACLAAIEKAQGNNSA